MKPKTGKTRLRGLSPSSPVRLFVALCVIIFVCEALVMIVLAELPQVALWVVALLDATLLLGVLFPAFYFLAFRPLATDIRQREHAEKSLRETEAQFRATFDSTADGILAVDVEGKILHANRRFAELWRIPPPLVESGNDRALLECVLEQLADPDAFLAKVQALYDSDASDMDTLDFKDGRVFERFSVPMISGGVRTGRVWSFHDITARRRTELERAVSYEIAQGIAMSSELDDLLAQMHRALQRVIAAENCFVALHDPKTGLFSFPYFVDEQDSVPAPVAMSKSCTAYVYRRGQPVLMTPEVFRRLAEQGEVELVGAPSPSWMGVPLITPSGAIGVLVLQQYVKENIYTERDLAFLASVGSQVAVMIERKLAEESLRTSERRLQDAERVARIGSWEMDLASGAVIWSASLSRMVGRDPAQPAPAYTDLPRYYTPESWELLGAAIQATTTTGTEFELDLEVIREDGGHWWQTARGEAVRSPLGEVVGLHGTVLDITARRQAEDATAALEDRLRHAQKLETIGRLAGGVAHHLNNMLAVVLGHVELALSEVDSAQPLHEDLTTIQEAAARSADLTRQLLTYASKQVIVPKALDLNATLPATLAMVQRLLGENVSLTWRPAANLWTVNVDQLQVDQLLTNLCVNARDAIDKVGTVRIATANRVIDAQFCARHADAVAGEFVQLSVTDDGRGMSGDVLAHLFEPFFTTKDVGRGTGLGLATVYGIVRQSNGFITVASAEGQGTTFDVYFPRHVVEVQPARTTSDAVAARPRGSETILVVDDEPALLRMTARALEAQGYTVLLACGPGEAVRLAELHGDDIDLLLTDVLMPEMNGHDLANMLVPAHAHLKCLFMSGFPEHDGAGLESIAAGVHFLAKPFAIATLVAKVRTALDRA